MSEGFRGGRNGHALSAVTTMPTEERLETDCSCTCELVLELMSVINAGKIFVINAGKIFINAGKIFVINAGKIFVINAGKIFVINAGKSRRTRRK